MPHIYIYIYNPSIALINPGVPHPPLRINKPVPFLQGGFSADGVINVTLPIIHYRTQNWGKGKGAGSGFSTPSRNQRAQNGATPGEAQPYGPRVAPF